MSERRTGVLIVDHGSRLSSSNELLDQVVASFRQAFGSRFPIVEPAHMELASPTIADGYRRCVEQGAETILLLPFFLGPGKHWEQDLPRLLQEAAIPFPETESRLAAPLGNDPLMTVLLLKRIEEGLREQRNQET